MRTNKDERRIIESATREFPEVFGLRDFPGYEFRIMEPLSYVAAGRTILTIAERRADRARNGSGWSVWSQMSHGELKQESIRLNREVPQCAGF